MKIGLRKIYTEITALIHFIYYYGDYIYNVFHSILVIKIAYHFSVKRNSWFKLNCCRWTWKIVHWSKPLSSSLDFYHYCVSSHQLLKNFVFMRKFESCADMVWSISIYRIVYYVLPLPPKSVNFQILTSNVLDASAPRLH